jgi:hypothetical protein
MRWKKLAGRKSGEAAPSRQAKVGHLSQRRGTATPMAGKGGRTVNQQVKNEILEKTSNVHITWGIQGEEEDCFIHQSPPS